MPWIAIKDPEDARLDPFRTVAEPTLVKQAGLFVAEGRRVTSALIEHWPERIQSIVVTRAARAALGDVLDRVPAAATTLEVESPSVLKRVAGVHFHQGCLALAARPPTLDLPGLIATLDARPRLWLVLEGVTDPDNVGTLFRSAASFGAGAVLLGPGCAHPLYRKALRTSVGTALRIPFAESGAWPDDLRTLSDDGVTVVALSPREDAPDLQTVRREAGDSPVAVLMGSEADGLTAAAFAASARWARIPSDPAVDSLNVAAAGAIALYTFRVGGG